MKDKWVMLFNEKFKSRDRQLKIQATEYSRRLKDLNGEAAKLVAMQNEYVPREVFDRDMNSKNERFDRAIDQIKATSEERYKSLLATLDELTDYKTKQQGGMKVIQWLVGIGVSIIVAMGVKLFSQ